MASTLTSRDRARLKAQAHALEPVVQIGAAGITPSVIAEADRALTAHELIKVKIAGDDRATRVALGEELCERTGATAVHRVGKVLIAWRARPEDADDTARPQPTGPESKGPQSKAQPKGSQPKNPRSKGPRS